MKNKIFSGALFVENLKRYIGLVIAGFLIMFVSAPFELLTLLSAEQYSSWFVKEMLADQNFGFILVQMGLPICAAVAVFQYLYRVNSTGVMHAMPFSRTKLYVTNYVSGLVISLLPQILTWVLLIALKRPTIYSTYSAENPLGTDIYSFAACCEWLLYAVLIVFFTYSIAVLACMVSGNAVIATLTGIAFNFLVGALTLIFLGYVETNCYGFDIGSGIFERVLKTHPMFLVITDAIGIKEIIIFTLIALALAIAVRYIYYLRKLERCGDSYVFIIMQDIIGFLFVLGCSSATGLVLYEGMGFWAYLIGGLIGFVVGQMITRKTFRLLNKKTLKNLIIFFVLMVIIVCCFVFDVFGIEKKVPDVDKIEYVEYYDSFMTYDGLSELVHSDDPEVLAAVTGLHKDIVTNLDEVKNHDNRYSTFNSIRLKYHLKAGSVVERSYGLSNEFIADNENIWKLVELSGLGKKAENIKTLGPDRLEMNITSNMFSGASECILENIELTNSQKQELLNALSDDIQNAILTDRLINKVALFSIDIEKTCSMNELSALMGKEQTPDQYFKDFAGYNDFFETDFGNEGIASFGYGINAGYKKTIEVLCRITGRSLREMLLPEDCIALISAGGDFLWKEDFYDKYAGKDGYFRNIPMNGKEYIGIEDDKTVFDILLNGSAYYNQDYLWVSIFQNVSLFDNPAYKEIYTEWLSVKDLPASLQPKAQQLLNSYYGTAEEIR